MAQQQQISSSSSPIIDLASAFTVGRVSKLNGSDFKAILKKRLADADHKAMESGIVRHSVPVEKSVRRMMDKSPTDAKQLVLNDDPGIKQARLDGALDRFRRDSQKFIRYSCHLPLDEVNEMLRRAAVAEFGCKLADEYFRDGRLTPVKASAREGMEPLEVNQLTDDDIFQYYLDRKIQRRLWTHNGRRRMQWPPELGLGAAYSELPESGEEKDEEDLEKRQRQFYWMSSVFADMKNKNTKQGSLRFIIEQVRDRLDKIQPAEERETRLFGVTISLYGCQMIIKERSIAAAVTRVMDTLMKNYTMLQQWHEISQSSSS